MAKTPRPYQLDGINQVSKCFAEGKKRVIVNMQTGAGKTLLSLEMAKRACAKGKRVLFVADRRLLVEQCAREAREYGLDVGMIIRGHQENPQALFQVASKDTFLARIKRGTMDGGRFSFIIVDECHRSLTRTWKEMISNCGDSYVCGLTATPVRPNGSGLGPDDFQAIVKPIQSSELLQQGFIVPAICYSPEFPDLKGVGTGADGDYLKIELAKKMNKNSMVGKVVKHWRDLAQDRPTLLYGCDIAHSQAMVLEFNRASIPALHLDGTDSDDDELMKAAFADFNSGKIKILSSADLLTEGVDLPIASCLQIVRPTKSLRLYLQMMGRGLRTYIDPITGAVKKNALVIDHAGVVKLHGCPGEDIDFPLDTGGRKIEEIVKEKREKGLMPALPTTCPKCFTMFTGLNSCPSCGWKPRKAAKAKANNPGKLVLVSGSANGAGVDPDTRIKIWQASWNKALAVSANAGVSPGGNFLKALMIFKSSEKRSPEGLGLRNMPPTDGWKMAVSAIYPGFRRRKD